MLLKNTKIKIINYANVHDTRRNHKNYLHLNLTLQEIEADMVLDIPIVEHEGKLKF